MRTVEVKGECYSGLTEELGISAVLSESIDSRKVNPGGLQNIQAPALANVRS